MAIPKILLQLDTDPQPSVFDSVVAADAGVDHLLRYGGIHPESVRDLVYGAIFTRRPADLEHTAIFIGGSDVQAGERLLEKVVSCFFGPMRVSVLMDANGANTTAAAAVLCAAKHVRLENARALVLAASGPVGRRVSRLLARQGATLLVGSRQAARAAEVAQDVARQVPDAQVEPVETTGPGTLGKMLRGVDVLIACGAPGVALASRSDLSGMGTRSVAIDLNAVPPVGLEGIEIQDQAQLREGVTCFGAIGVGGLKMKIHKKAVKRLFTATDLVLDADEVFAIGQELV